MPFVKSLASVCVCIAVGGGSALADNWPAFRGVDACGVSASGKTATTWDVPAGKNVKWKTEIPGLAHSSPIVWGDKLFVTTAYAPGVEAELKVGLYGAGDSAKDMVEHEFKVYCLDKNTGKILWEKTAHKGKPKVARHTKATHANSTPATDGKNLVVFFGSEGLYCYTLDGELRWQKDLGVLDAGPEGAQMQWGFASSPILVDGRVIVQCDILGGPFVAALDVKDGREVWRTKRDEVCTWSTPTISRGGGRTQLVLNGYKHIGGYDFESGKELWKLSGGGDVPVPTPVTGHDLIYIASAHGPVAPIYAIKPQADGTLDVPPEGAEGRYVAWWKRRVGVYMQTLLVYGDELYACRDNGVLFVFDARSGEQHYSERLGAGSGGFSASPVAADGKVYVTSEDGDVHVVKAGKKFEVLATNPMGEICMATPAISDGTLFFRTQKNVVAIAPRD